MGEAPENFTNIRLRQFLLRGVDYTGHKIICYYFEFLVLRVCILHFLFNADFLQKSGGQASSLPHFQPVPINLTVYGHFT